MAHLDFARLVERSLRRSGLPVAYTQGFNPRFKLSFQDALPVGVGSAGEWVTVTLQEDCPPDVVRAALEAALPECVQLVSLCRGKPPPVERTTYAIDVESGFEQAVDALTAFLELDTFILRDDPAERDVRAGVIAGRATPTGLEVDLVEVEGRPPRPGPVVAALDRIVEARGGTAVRFGPCTKHAVYERLPGDDSWPDERTGGEGAARAPAASSSTNARPTRAASRS